MVVPSCLVRAALWSSALVLHSRKRYLYHPPSILCFAAPPPSARRFLPSNRFAAKAERQPATVTCWVDVVGCILERGQAALVLLHAMHIFRFDRGAYRMLPRNRGIVFDRPCYGPQAGPPHDLTPGAPADIILKALRHLSSLAQCRGHSWGAASGLHLR